MSCFLRNFAEFIRTQPFDYTRITEIKDGVSETMEGMETYNCLNTYSVAKPFTMTAIGLLYDRGLIRPEDKVTEILRDDLPEEGMDSRWHDATVDMALTHRLGLPFGFLDIDTHNANEFGEDFLRYMLTYPLETAPGAEYCYSDGAFYLLSRIASKVTGESLDKFLWRELFLPLGFREAAWSSCPMGYSVGATGLYIGSEDMAKLGELYLNGGIYGSKRIVSEEWAAMAVERGYAFDHDSKGRGYSKGGMNGQLLAVIPKDRRVVAIQSFGGDCEAMVNWIYANS